MKNTWLLLSASVLAQRQLTFSNSNSLSLTSPEETYDEVLKKDIITSAHWANAAYCSKTQLSKWSCGASCSLPNEQLSVKYYNSDWLSGTGLYLAIHESKPKIVVSFRGTSNFQSFMGDLTALKLDYRYKSGTVHSGFYRNYSRISRVLIQTLRGLLDNPAYKNHTVVIVGHSYGGAVAIFLALELKVDLKYPNDIVLRTFGAPRVGDQVFTDFVTKSFFNQPNNLNPILRVTQHNDPIPHLPLSIMGFKHFPHEMWIMKDKVRLNRCKDYDSFSNGTFISYEDSSCAASQIGWNLNSHNHLLGISFGTTCSSTNL